MDITIAYTFLPQTDPDAALGFYRDALGFEVRNDVGYSGMRWLTVGPPNQPQTAVVLHPPAVDPGITEQERETILDLIAKGTYGAALTLATDDLQGVSTSSKLPGPRSSRNRWTNRTVCATAHFATRRATCCASTRLPDARAT